MEAALVRVPTVATPTDAFAHAIQAGRNGLLAESLADWQTHLERMVEHAAQRRAMGECAYRDVLQGYSPQVRGQQAVENLARLSQQLGKGLPNLAPGPAAGSSPGLGDESRPTNLDLALYTVRNRGLPILMGQVWVYFRRLAAPIFPFRRQGADHDHS
jgi:hypothetical protein